MRRPPVYMLALLMLLSGCGGDQSDPPENSGSSGIAPVPETTIILEAPAVQETTATTSTAVTAPAGSDAPTEATEPMTPEDWQLLDTRDEIRDSGCIVGAAFVGYIDSELSETGIREHLDSSQTIAHYSYLDTAPLVRQAGAELYALTPLEGYAITVYPAEVTEEGTLRPDRSAPVYQGKPGECIVLQCNLSEVYSNVLVSVSNGSDQTEFQPMLSMKDGRLAVIDKCKDLSVYERTWDEFVNYSYESLLDTLEIQEAIKQGMALRCMDQIVDVRDGRRGLMFALGTDRDDQFVNEQFYAFGIESDLKYYMDPITGEWEYLSEG